MKRFFMILRAQCHTVSAPCALADHDQQPVALQAQSEPVAHGVRNDLPRPFETYRDWGELPDNTESWAAVTAVEPAPDGKTIYVVHRCFENSCEGRSEDPILKFDYSGRLLASFGQGLFLFPMEQRLITKETSG